MQGKLVGECLHWHALMQACMHRQTGKNIMPLETYPYDHTQAKMQRQKDRSKTKCLQWPTGWVAEA